MSSVCGIQIQILHVLTFFSLNFATLLFFSKCSLISLISVQLQNNLLYNIREKLLVFRAFHNFRQEMLKIIEISKQYLKIEGFDFALARRKLILLNIDP